MPNLKEKYTNELRAPLQEKLGIQNVMALPKLTKVVINMGVGEAANDKKYLESAVQNLTAISGQKPVITKARKAISNFKLRIGDPVGVKVTLRGAKMYEFLDRFISISSPRIRDFRGLPSKGFDGQGNYNFGISEQIIFSEINYDKVNTIRGINITIATNTDDDFHAYELLVGFGFPINEYKNKKKGK